MGTTHYLKCLAPFYDAIERGDKSFEIRLDDRAYQTGDLLALERHDPDVGPLDRSGMFPPPPALVVEVTFVLRGGQFGLETGYVGMAVRRAEATEPRSAKLSPFQS
ncbi:DUF3850 domain-containing protein [Rhizobium sp. NPDC090275]|uniref:DUF3850 domain-containing protein n=1 Tax=Rhizobium sp. NPDC090275 TaxID=3364498 RepID=UPI00383AA5C8